MSLLSWQTATVKIIIPVNKLSRHIDVIFTYFINIKFITMTYQKADIVVKANEKRNSIIPTTGQSKGAFKELLTIRICENYVALIGRHVGKDLYCH